MNKNYQVTTNLIVTNCQINVKIRHSTNNLNLKDTFKKYFLHLSACCSARDIYLFVCWLAGDFWGEGVPQQAYGGQRTIYSWEQVLFSITSGCGCGTLIIKLGSKELYPKSSPWPCQRYFITLKLYQGQLF